MHKNISCYHLSYCYERARIAQSIRSLNCGLNNQGVVVRFPSETRHIFFPTILRQALGHIQPSIQWVAGDSFAWGKAKPVLFQENGMQKTASSQKHIKKDKKNISLITPGKCTTVIHYIHLLCFSYFQGIAAL